MDNVVKTIAEDRHEYMNEFLNEFYDEWDGKNNKLIIWFSRLSQFYDNHIYL